MAGAPTAPNCGTSCHNRNPDALASSTGLWLRVNAKHLLADAGAPTLIRKDENSPALYVLMPMRV